MSEPKPLTDAERAELTAELEDATREMARLGARAYDLAERLKADDDLRAGRPRPGTLHPFPPPGGDHA